MDALYQAQILALARLSRDGDLIAHPSHSGTARNPLCGDEVSLNLMIEEAVITKAHVAVKGCALCEAGAGLLSEQAVGKTLGDLRVVGEALEHFLQNDDQINESFTAFTPVRDVKNRHKCVTLAFKSLERLT